MFPIRDENPTAHQPITTFVVIAANLSGLPSLGDAVGGVAFWAHIGGFLAGVALSWVFVRDDRGREGR